MFYFKQLFFPPIAQNAKKKKENKSAKYLERKVVFGLGDKNIPIKKRSYRDGLASCKKYTYKYDKGDVVHYWAKDNSLQIIPKLCFDTDLFLEEDDDIPNICITYSVHSNSKEFDFVGFRNIMRQAAKKFIYTTKGLEKKETYSFEFNEDCLDSLDEKDLEKLESK